VGQDTDTETYFTEIEAHFAFRRGTPFVLSSKDWALMKSWHDGGVPLAIVLEAIDTAFDARERSGRKSPISSLSYCRHSVTDLWEERKQQLVGSQGSVPELDPPGAVRELAKTISAIAAESDPHVRRVLDDVSIRLTTLAEKSRSAPALEQQLIEVENAMIEELLESIAEDTKRAMLEAIDAELARYRIDNEETKAKTREDNLRRLLRRELRIPRLSLFG